ncbi:50S ribosomal protein L3 [Candidatus Pacearchaeota archaeon]|nr:50S ribosomal protein L3 [Candidatus Pacearchaeota archaeon]
MAKLSSPHAGSLQFWPRKRAAKSIPSVNWSVVKGKDKATGLLGFLAYKAGMATVLVKDSTPDSLSKGKKIYLPVTILEAPHLKVFSIRFYKDGKIMKEALVSNDKELKKVLRLPKEVKSLDSQIPQSFDDIRLIVYSIAKQTSVKKTPDLAEVGIRADNKLEFAKSLVNKEITLKDFLHYELLDIRGLTRGKGFSGPVKRFGITLKQHKTEKGVRRPGSLAPWHPARVTFRTPQAGQLGMFTRVHYNQKVISSGSISEKDINPGTGFKHYGKIKTDYLFVKGSVQGPVKRQILLTPSFRPTKLTAKRKYELQEVFI